MPYAPTTKAYMFLHNGVLVHSTGLGHASLPLEKVANLIIYAMNDLGIHQILVVCSRGKALTLLERVIGLTTWLLQVTS